MTNYCFKQEIVPLNQGGTSGHFNRKLYSTLQKIKASQIRGIDRRLEEYKLMKNMGKRYK